MKGLNSAEMRVMTYLQGLNPGPEIATKSIANKTGLSRAAAYDALRSLQHKGRVLGSTGYWRAAPPVHSGDVG